MRTSRSLPLVAACVAGLLVAACSDAEPDAPQTLPAPLDAETDDGSGDIAPEPPDHLTAVPTSTADIGDPDEWDGAVEPRAQTAALFLTPAEATHLTITDYAMIKELLGYEGLTSDDLMTDRLEFWRAVEANTVMVTGGLLRADTSLFDLRYDFTQDDVRWEARWAGDSQTDDGVRGYALQFRADLDLNLVGRAIADGVPVLAGAQLDDEHRLVTRGAAADGTTWGDDRTMVSAVGRMQAETIVARRGCVPFLDALGVDATIEHIDAITQSHDIDGLLPVEMVVIGFIADQARVRLSYPVGTSNEQMQADVRARAELAADWPTVESIGFSDGFAITGLGEGEDLPVLTEWDDSNFAGAILTVQVTNTNAAANLALADLIPLGVCNELSQLEEPTGLP